MDVLEAMKKEMLRRKLSHRTVITYLFCIRKFLKNCHKDPKWFSKKRCRGVLRAFLDRKIYIIIHYV
ncbi:MAG: hypothetical protein V1837_05220 [Candidatus Woesearchaeota archaeon]